MGEKKDLRTDFLFALPSFLSGVGRICDLWGVFDSYNTSSTQGEADTWALYSDWRITGQDLRDAMIDETLDYRTELKMRQGDLFRDSSRK